MMKKIIFSCIFALLYVHISAQDVPGGFAYTDNLTGTGIDKVYFLNTLTGATITYTSSAISVRFYRYTLSSADREPIPASDISISSSGGESQYTISNLIDSRGYLIEVNGVLRNALWIIDYSIHQPVLTSIEAIEDEFKCSVLGVNINKSDELYVYGTNGGRRSIVRKYTISYDNLEWNEASKKFVSVNSLVPATEMGTSLSLPSLPLKDTRFILRGDQFGEYFGMAKEISSPLYRAVAVEGHIDYEQERRNAGNEVPSESGLGGSAPVTISFFGHGNEPVVSFYTWFIFAKNNTGTPIARFTDRDIRYTFNDSGDYIVKLEIANQASSCIDTLSVALSISDSFLDQPNFFSPGSTSGGNTEFKVAYKSLVRFKCTIFNRWGVKLYEWTDPAKGWDGRYKGKFVNPGVYFYVIDAMGSDGKHYKRGGDINILSNK